MNTDRDDPRLIELLNAVRHVEPDDAERYLRVIDIVADLCAGKDSRDASDRLCRVAKEAYPHDQLGDVEILNSSLTPVLVRFFAASLSRYSDQLRELESKKLPARATTNERTKLLARALLFIGHSGNPTSKFSDDDCQTYLQAFGHHFLDPASGRTIAAYDKGLEAAYSRFREREENPEGGHNPSDRDKTLGRLRALLRQHGYRRSPQRATLPPLILSVLKLIIGAP